MYICNVESQEMSANPVHGGGATAGTAWLTGRAGPIRVERERLELVGTSVPFPQLELAALRRRANSSDAHATSSSAFNLLSEVRRNDEA